MSHTTPTLLKLCAMAAATLLVTACGGGGDDDSEGAATFATSTGLKTSGVAGQAIYTASCASCHGTSVAGGVNYSRTLSAIASNKGGMGYLATSIKTAQADDIATYLAYGAVGPALPAQTITFAAPGNQTVGVATPVLAASADSNLAVTIASSTPSVCTVTNTALTLMGAGACTLTATQAGSTAFAAATPVTYTFTVAAATAPVLTAQTITLTAPGNQTMGVTPAALVATSTSGLAVTLASSTTSVCTVSGTTLTLVAAGACTVTANQAGSATVAAAAPASSTFTVAPAVTVGVALTGKALYASNGVLSCGGCHGTPPSLQKVLNGANNPSAILAAINNNTGGMGLYIGKFNTQNLADLAAYLATPGI